MPLETVIFCAISDQTQTNEQTREALGDIKSKAERSEIEMLDGALEWSSNMPDGALEWMRGMLFENRRVRRWGGEATRVKTRNTKTRRQTGENLALTWTDATSR